MSMANVRSALADAFEDGGFFTATAIAWENASFSPPADAPWARFTFVPARPDAASLGTGGMDEVTGFVQIDLNYPQGTGESVVMGKYDSLRNTFKTGSRFSYGGDTVIVRSCGRSPGREVDGVYRVSVTIYFYSQIQR